MAFAGLLLNRKLNDRPSKLLAGKQMEAGPPQLLTGKENRADKLGQKSHTRFT
jgi:hypothetical protein